ncbi:MAG: glutamine-hydrolyzing carbamoyl-phosphate synthase small subunit [Planctomycetes bacterium]|nr:glutamine-hydrolyzing carbamoyl-phosphate synthase small subunit [Planctomycetota bacterium]
MIDHKNWSAQRATAGYLALADGSIFPGRSVGAPVDRLGEAVFNTAMSGYQEILSDPSYGGQFVCLTAPEVGVTGTNNADMESSAGRAAGLLAHRICARPSNWRSTAPLTEWLRYWEMPALDGIDTRALTLRLRARGTQKAFLCASGTVPETEGVAHARAWEGLDGLDYAGQATCPAPYEWDMDADPTSRIATWTEAPPPIVFRIVVYDFGLKRSILRCLRQQGMAALVMPARTPAAEALRQAPDGVFLSNGPGDPAGLPYAVETVRELWGRVPLAGICLGHQIMARACGADTFRLPFGHHGANHPVQCLADGRTLISSQNHNFAVDPKSVDAGRLEITHISLNDGSIEGLRGLTAPAFSVQFHPEASPGPHDAVGFFAAFRALIAAAKK